MGDERWPSLPYAAWKDTRDTVHMWTQIVGKIALATAPPLNHSWGVALQVTARGLATRVLPYERRSFTIEFDFVSHRLVIKTSEGEQRHLPLAPQTVAEFYRVLMRTLEEMHLPVKIWSMPVEVPTPIRFEVDTEHRSYDPV